MGRPGIKPLFDVAVGRLLAALVAVEEVEFNDVDDCALVLEEILINIASKPINIRWIRTDSQPTCIASYYRQLSTIINIKIMRSITDLLAWDFGPQG